MQWAYDGSSLVFLRGLMPDNENVQLNLKDRVARIWAAAASRAADFEPRNRADAPPARTTPDQIDKAQKMVREGKRSDGLRRRFPSLVSDGRRRSIQLRGFAPRGCGRSRHRLRVERAGEPLRGRMAEESLR
jgi:hypothetical protein